VCPADPAYFAGAQSYESWAHDARQETPEGEINRSVEPRIDLPGFCSWPPAAYHRPGEWDRRARKGCAGVKRDDGRTSDGGTSRALAPGAWEQGAWLWHAAFYLLLSVSALSALLTGGSGGGGRVALAVLALAFGAWYALLALPHPMGGDPPLLSLIFIVGAIGLWYGLVGLHPAFHLMLFILYPLVFSRLRLGWAIPVALLLNGVTLLHEVVESGRPLTQDWSPLRWALVSTTLGIAFAVWITRIIHQSIERRLLIEQLQATRQELAQAERDAGRLAERGRLAREIHDTLAQGLISIVLLLEATEDALPPGSSTARRHLGQALRTARENLAEARRLVWELRPESLATASLAEALERQAQRLGEETGIAATATVTGRPRQLPADTEVALLRVAQEALANVRKHSAASRVALTLSYMEDETVLDVRDDGAGFDPGQVCSRPSGGYGLRLMDERVRELGGRLTVETSPGNGTTIAVSLPEAGTLSPDARPSATLEEVP
jgi:signal transduction histidine kinase